MHDHRTLVGLKLTHSFKGMPENAIGLVWSRDGNALVTTGDNGVVAWWDIGETRPRNLEGHEKGVAVAGAAWHPIDRILATAGDDRTIRLWDVDAGQSRVLLTLEAQAWGVTWSPDGSLLAVTDEHGDIRVFDVDGVLLHRANVHKTGIHRALWSPDGKLLITGAGDESIGFLESRSLQLLTRIQARNSMGFWDIALSPNGDRIACVSEGVTSILDLHGRMEVELETIHTSGEGVKFSPDGDFVVSSFMDGIVVWRCRDWERVADLPRDTFATTVGGLAFHPREPLLAVRNNGSRRIEFWRIDFDLLNGIGTQPDSRRYVNAKVVLLGDTGVGKSGLGLVLSGQKYQPTDSTHGRNVWVFDAQEIHSEGGRSQSREVLLWDLAGQPGYRLVHQLHLNEVAVALVVFDSRSETDPFTGVKHWVRALAQARRLEGDAAVPMRAYLVAARADRGGAAVTKGRVQAMVDELGLDGFFETSAKEGWQVTDLAQAIRQGIDWDALPMVSSSALFDSIKQFLLDEKQQGRVLSTADDLFRAFRRAQSDAVEEGELRASFVACIGRLESRGLIRHLQFGDLVLLQPELLDAYASAMVQAAKDEPDGLGFIPEKDALAGDFRLAKGERVADRAQEKLLLIATIEELLRHEIALKEMTDQGMDLVFPSQFTRERPDAPDIPGKEVTFLFEGPLYNIYATLAVRLSHSLLFQRQAMWRNAAAYTATVGGSCGIHLHELEEGRAELSLFYEQQTGQAVRSQFEAYVSEHLQLRAIPGTVTRRRSRVCPSCGYALPENLVQRRLERTSAPVQCPICDLSRIPLIDKEELAPAATVAAVEAMNRSADARRDLDVAATRLKGKIETGDFDVFLCHNSKDKEEVKAIGEQLKKRGILPWLDVWEIRPGTRWQKALAGNIKSIRSAAVFIGPKGPGPWQDLEVEALLQQLAKRGCPIMPVILQGRRGRPRLPTFLDLWHMIDMRQDDPDPLDQLIWGITGQKKNLH
jgi:WD40 repeat protein